MEDFNKVLERRGPSRIVVQISVGSSRRYTQEDCPGIHKQRQKNKNLGRRQGNTFSGTTDIVVKKRLNKRGSFYCIVEK